MSKVAISGVAAYAEADSVRPYPPSFMDRMTDWVRHLPIPSWLFYLGLFLALALIYSGIKWADGTYPVGTFIPFHLLSVLTPVYGIALFHYLDNSAQAALDAFRATMQIDDVEYRLLRYRFTTLPPLPTVIAAGIGGLYGLGGFLYLTPLDLQKFKVLTSLLAAPLDLLFLALGYAAAAVIIYHSLRQLRMVSRVYTDYARVDLFNLRPMYALSKLTARTAVGFGIITYAWVYVTVSLGNRTELSAPSLVEPAVFTVFVLLGFVLPLMGAHRLLREEKATAKDAALQHLKATIAEVHRRREAGDFAGMDSLNETIDALQKEHGILDKISTWPWQPETLRGVATAILLPIVVWAITRVLDRFWTF